MKCKIFGISVEVNGNRPYMDKLYKELSLYPNSKIRSELIINFHPENYFNNKHYKFNSPGIIKCDFNRFLIKFSCIYVEYIFNKLPEINVVIKESRQNSKFMYLKDTNDYETLFDKIGQIFHESVMIPAVILFFNSKLSPIHSTSVYDVEKDNITMIAGTGGVGKTTIENIFLLNNSKYGFVADDFSIVDSSGTVYSNFNYPKIYGYNALKNKKFDEKVNSYISGISKILWNYRKSKAPYFVRRKISPEIITNNKLIDKSKISKFFYLIRYSGKSVGIQSHSSHCMAKMLISILKTEYNKGLFNYLHWYEITSLMKDKEENISQNIFDNLMNVNVNFLKFSKIIKTIKIPHE